MTNEDHFEIRLTVDPSTQRYICEKHAWTLPPRGRGRAARYWFYRWDGKVMAMGASSEPRAVNLGDRFAQNLADVPVGTPLCSMVTLYGEQMACLPAEMVKQAAGLTLDGKNMDAQLAAMLKDPAARWEHPAGAPANDQVLTLGQKKLTFDSQLALLKAIDDSEGRKATWRVTKFVDRMPVQITTTLAAFGAFPSVETEFKAIDGQCGVMSRDHFDSLLHLAIPKDVAVTDLSARGQNATPVIRILSPEGIQKLR
jgi:hypothetical protein